MSWKAQKKTLISEYVYTLSLSYKLDVIQSQLFKINTTNVINLYN